MDGRLRVFHNESTQIKENHSQPNKLLSLSIFSPSTSLKSQNSPEIPPQKVRLQAGLQTSE